MITESYRKYIKSVAWRKKRLQVFAYYGKRCYACGTLKNIQVHHLTYQHFGNERIYELRPLCKRCHDEVGRLHWRLGKRTSGFVVFAKFMKMKQKGK